MHLFAVLLLWGTFVSASCGGQSSLATIADSNDDVRLEYPAVAATDDLYVYQGFTSCYNHSTLVPDWVAYELTSEELKGQYTSTSNFSRDPHVRGRQASREDYSRSGWDKGHMCPKADLKWSEKAWWESHYFTNVCPQNHEFNAGSWNRLENKVRDWARRYGSVHVVCGPVFTDCQYGTVGSAMVSIPDAFFKALLVPTSNGYAAIAFLMENRPGNQSLKACAMSVDDLETLLGRDLFPALDDSMEEDVESRLDLGFWGLK